MKLAVLRLSRQSGQPEQAAADIGVECASVWHVGDRSLRGRIRADCGFVAAIIDAASVREMTEEVSRFVHSKQVALARAVAAGWDAELDIGVTVGDSMQFTCTVPLEPELLKTLGNLGVRLSISAYPTSDEAESQTD